MPECVQLRFPEAKPTATPIGPVRRPVIPAPSRLRSRRPGPDVPGRCHKVASGDQGSPGRGDIAQHQKEFALIFECAQMVGVHGQRPFVPEARGVKVAQLAARKTEQVERIGIARIGRNDIIRMGTAAANSSRAISAGPRRDGTRPDPPPADRRRRRAWQPWQGTEGLDGSSRTISAGQGLGRMLPLSPAYVTRMSIARATDVDRSARLAQARRLCAQERHEV